MEPKVASPVVDAAQDWPLLDVHQTTRNFGGLCAVNSVSFGIESGEIFGLIGPNGAGKTTLFNLITGLIPPSSGSLIFNKKSLVKKRPDQIASMGISRTFQNIRLFGNLSAMENVIIARHIHQRASLFSTVFGLPNARHEEQQNREKAMELLTLVNLADRAYEKARNLSYGDQRLLEIARALALEPKLLLLDEPGAGMNSNEKHRLTDFIRQIRDQFNLTVLLIEHHVPLVMGLCDRIAVLHFGQLIALGAPEAVKNDPAVIDAYLGEEQD